MRITVYTSPHCGFCTKIKEFYSAQELDFQEKDITKNEEFKKELKDFGVPGVPFSLIEKGEKTERIVGFDEQKLKNALN